jgi:hypothetical protein
MKFIVAAERDEAKRKGIIAISDIFSNIVIISPLDLSHSGVRSVP